MKPNQKNRYRALFALAATAVATTTAHAQLDGSNGINMGGDSLDGRITFAETITDISGAPGIFPQGWLTPNMDLANIIVPVSQFTGVNNDGSLVNDLDLIPLKPASITLGGDTIYNWSEVVTADNGLTQTGSNIQIGGPLITATTITQGANDLIIAQNGAGRIGIGGVTAPKAYIHTDQSMIFGANNLSGSINAGTASSDGTQIWPNGISIQTTSPNISSLKMSKTVTAAQGAGTFQQFCRNGVVIGSIYGNASSVAYLTTSDERLKENIRPSAKGLQEVMKLQVSDYSYKSNKGSSETGFIAQQIYTLYPQVVKVGGEDASKDPWTVDYGKVTPLLAKAIQELKQEKDGEIAELRAENAELKKLASEMKELKALVAALEGKSNETVTVSLEK